MKIGIVFAGILILSLFGLSSPILKNPSLKLFRVLFPSWRFFETLQPIPRIYFRVGTGRLDHSAWKPLLIPSPPRRLRHLFHNPEENLRLAFQVQVEQLLNDIAESEPTSEFEFEKLPAFHIVSTQVRELILAQTTLPIKFYQFKIGVIEFNGSLNKTQPEWTDSILSPALEV